MDLEPHHLQRQEASVGSGSGGWAGVRERSCKCHSKSAPGHVAFQKAASEGLEEKCAGSLLQASSRGRVWTGDEGWERGQI